MVSFSDLTEQDKILDNSHFLKEVQFNIWRESARISRQAFRCVSKNIFRIRQAHTEAADCYFDTVLLIWTSQIPRLKRAVNFWRKQCSYTIHLPQLLRCRCKRWYIHSVYVVFSTFASGRTPLVASNWPFLFLLVCLFFRWKNNLQVAA